MYRVGVYSIEFKEEYGICEKVLRCVCSFRSPKYADWFTSTARLITNDLDNCRELGFSCFEIERFKGTMPDYLCRKVTPSVCRLPRGMESMHSDIDCDLHMNYLVDWVNSVQEYAVDHPRADYAELMDATRCYDF